MTDAPLEPACTIIAKAGGVDAVAAITGKHISRVYRWMRSKEDGGTGGIIPQGPATALLQHAEDRGLPITPADFFATPAPKKGRASQCA